MSKRIQALLMSSAMLFSSVIGIAANEQTTNIATTPTSDKIASRLGNEINQAAYKTMLPGVTDQIGMSASVIFHSFTANREANGDVTLTINESFNSVRGYYQHLATDANGENFTPNKDVNWYINKEGISSVRLSADAVSNDGYIYLYFDIAPVNTDAHLMPTNYKIPVDYASHKVNNNSFLEATKDREFQMSASATFSNFTAAATRLADGTVEVIIDVKASNAVLWFKQLATSTAGEIFMPSRDGWYKLGDGVMQNNKSYRMVLPAKNISASGYVYYSIIYDITPIGLYPVDSIRIPVL